MTDDAKAAWRAARLSARRARSAAERETARAAICAAVLTRAGEWTRVAAYEPMPSEPGSVELLAGLAARGIDVLVPIVLPDRDLDWRSWPAGGPLGVTAIGGAQAALVPALAVARDGTRLGRGGGSYDRALPRAAAGAVCAALLFEDELVDALPSDPWDAPVRAVVRPSGWTTLTD